MKQPIKSEQLTSMNVVSLRDGRVALIRPVNLSDAPLIEAMHHRLSMESLYHRYLRPYMPSLAEIERICQLEGGAGGAAFVAVLPASPERILGLGYYLSEGNPQVPIADPALLIEDGFQGLGLGKLLFQHLGQYARSRGVRAFQMLIHRANPRMMGVIERSGFPFQKGNLDFGAREIEVLL